MAWRLAKQLNGMNERISEDYEQLVKTIRHGRVRKVHEVTEKGFCTFLGVLLAVRIEGRKGRKLWDWHEPEGYGNKVDLGKYMKEFRFLEINRFIPFLFADVSKQAEDPWWQFSSGIEQCNLSRQQGVHLSLLKVLMKV